MRFLNRLREDGRALPRRALLAAAGLAFCALCAAIFWLWQRSEGTLSIHSITTQRREAFYWATVFATFALGTALGDFTATSLNLGYLDSGILFMIVILIPALARWQLGLNGIAAFWMSYIVTRPLGASFADYVSKPRDISGVNFGDGRTAGAALLAVAVLVAYLTLARRDIQASHGPLALQQQDVSTAVPERAAALEPNA